MATTSTTTLPGQNTTDAEWRTQVQFYHDTFALGCTQTGDTGQITISTSSRPTVANTVVGYEVWRFADSLQSTKPVFWKVEYGSSSGSANGFGVWITIGTGSSGAGAITGVLFARTQINGGSTGATLNNAFGSAATNRFTIATHLSFSTTPCMWLALERTKDSTGADTGTGLIFAWGGGTAHKSQVLPFGAIAPTAENGIPCILSSNNPTTYTGDQGIGLMIPILGVAIQPGLNVCITMASDFANYAQPAFTLYGGTHTWQHCGPNLQQLRVGGGNSVDSNTRLLIRFE